MSIGTFLVRAIACIKVATARGRHRCQPGGTQALPANQEPVIGLPTLL